MASATAEAAPLAALLVRVAGRDVELPAAKVTQVLRGTSWTRVPHAPDSLLGLANMRGQLLPVLSLGHLLGEPAAPVPETARVVVVDAGAQVGLLVDQVVSFAAASAAGMLDLPSLLARDFGRLIRAPRRGGAGRSIADIAAPSDAAADAIAAEEVQFVALRVGGQHHALPIDQVGEIVDFPAELATLPRSGQAMLGVMAHRGKLLPLVSLPALLGQPTEPGLHGGARVVVVRLGEVPVGLVVDAMPSILRLAADAIDPVPQLLTRGKGEARVEAIGRLGGGRLIGILSTALLFDAETQALVAAQSSQRGANQGRAGMSAIKGPGTGDPAIQDGAAERFVVFRLGAEEYGLPLAAIQEVVRRPDNLTRVPRAPPFVEGLMNLRGRIVPVIDQRRRFAVDGAAAARGRIIVVALGRLLAGFAVDAVSELITVSTAALREAPDLVADGERVFDRVAVERDGRVILLIDPQALLDQAERDVLEALAAAADEAGAS
jgi:purine-binding chemotaxis protein CheW